MKRIITILIIICLVVGAGIYAYLNYIPKASALLNEKTIFTSNSPITASFVTGDDIIIGTADGKLYALDKDGNVKWTKDIGANISQINADKNGNILVCSVYFYLFDTKGEKIFYKGYKNYIGLSGKFLTNRHIELVYQSLTDLSYFAAEVDMKGKTITSQKIPDLGETSFIRITNSGNILFIGARGELYLLDNSGIVSDTTLDNKNSNLREIYAYLLPNGNIVCGYKASLSENKTVPVYLCSSKLQKIKVLNIDGPVNNVIVGEQHLVIATQEYFLLYDFKGNLKDKKIKFGFTPLGYSENSNEQAFLFTKQADNKNSKAIYAVSVFNDGKEKAKYLFTSAFIPQIIVDSKDDYIFLITQDTINLLYYK
jgi:hypothetical protein